MVDIVRRLRRLKNRYDQYRKLSEHLRANPVRQTVLTRQERKAIQQLFAVGGYKPGMAFHRWYYTVTGKRDPRFIPDWIMYTGLIARMNDRRMMHAWSDKAYMDAFIPDARVPYCALRCIGGRFYDHADRLLSAEEAEQCWRAEDRLIVKPSLESGGGRNVRVYVPSSKALAEVAGEYGRNFVCQRLVRQHPSVAAFNESSVNTVRVISLMWDNEIHICGQMLRVGEKGAVTDNVGRGQGVSVGILPDGTVREVCYGIHGKAFDTAEYFGVEKGHRLYGFDEVLRTVRKCHQRLPYFALVAWDIAIDADGGPVVLEYNVQAMGVKAFQYNNGPLFGDLTEQVLSRYGKEG